MFIIHYNDMFVSCCTIKINYLFSVLENKKLKSQVWLTRKKYVKKKKLQYKENRTKIRIISINSELLKINIYTSLLLTNFCRLVKNKHRSAHFYLNVLLSFAIWTAFFYCSQSKMYKKKFRFYYNILND